MLVLADNNFRVSGFFARALEQRMPTTGCFVASKGLAFLPAALPLSIPAYAHAVFRLASDVCRADRSQVGCLHTTRRQCIRLFDRPPPCELLPFHTFMSPISLMLDLSIIIHALLDQPLSLFHANKLSSIKRYYQFFIYIPLSSISCSMHLSQLFIISHESCLPSNQF